MISAFVVPSAAIQRSPRSPYQSAPKTQLATAAATTAT